LENAIQAYYFCTRAFSETDIADDLAKFEVFMLTRQGDDNQIALIKSSATLVAKLVKNAESKIHKNGADLAQYESAVLVCRRFSFSVVLS
jgi:hypothetical protein